MTQTESNVWAERLLQALDSGLFFGVGNHDGYVLRKPRWLCPLRPQDAATGFGLSLR